MKRRARSRRSCRRAGTTRRTGSWRWAIVPRCWRRTWREAFGMPGHPPQAAAISRNKLLTRRALQEAGLPTPWFASVAIESGAVAGACGRAVPGSRQAARTVGQPRRGAGEQRSGVRRRGRAAAELLQAPDVRVERDEAHGQALVESFIPGAEYAVEGLLSHGVVQIAGDLRQARSARRSVLRGDDLSHAFGGDARRAAAHRDRRHRCGPRDRAAPRSRARRVSRQRIERSTSSRSPHDPSAASAPVHCGFVRATAGLGGVSLEELLLRHALGEDVSSYAREPRASGVMMIPIPRRGIYRRVEGVDAALAVIGVGDVRITAKPDTTLVPLPEGRSYLGFIFANATEPATVDRALREAHACLHFAIDREVAVYSVTPGIEPGRRAPEGRWAPCRQLISPAGARNPGGKAAPSPKKKSSICFAMSSCASFCHGIRRYSLRIIFMRSSQSFQAWTETFSKTRFPSSPGHGGASSPGSSF